MQAVKPDWCQSQSILADKKEHTQTHTQTHTEHTHTHTHTHTGWQVFIQGDHSPLDTDPAWQAIPGEQKQLLVYLFCIFLGECFVLSVYVRDKLQTKKTERGMEREWEGPARLKKERQTERKRDRILKRKWSERAKNNRRRRAGNLLLL